MSLLLSVYIVVCDVTETPEYVSSFLCQVCLLECFNCDLSRLKSPIPCITCIGLQYR
jgi:hypothetical protein